MEKYVGASGRKYTVIEPPLGKGGEGTVYDISGMSSSVLKIYKDGKRTETRHRKLQAMAAIKLPDSTKERVTWPEDIVYSNGKFVGYVMPKMKGADSLSDIYTGKYNCSLSERITIAKNLCGAIHEVHNVGQVCGDLNPKNIGVNTKDDHVTLVDTDSYHITDVKGTTYRCEVGLSQYLPQEIQKKLKNGGRLDTVPLPTYSKQTDLFALAVHIFTLLMNGCHPFAAAVASNPIPSLVKKQSSVTAPQPNENICNGFFPFYQKKSGITIPKYAPDFEFLPQEMQKLFIKAFVDGHTNPAERPDTVIWYHALDRMLHHMKDCPNDPQFHKYPDHLKMCPWCKIDQKMKQTVSISIPSNNESQINQPTFPILQCTFSSGNGQQNSQSRSKTPVKNTQPKKKPIRITQATVIFWICTIVLTLFTHGAIMRYYGDGIVGTVFGTEYGDTVKEWGTNLGIWLGIWGFVISAFIGSILCNIACYDRGSMYGYRWNHYVYSFLASFAGTVVYIFVIYVLDWSITQIYSVLREIIYAGIGLFGLYCMLNSE